jgi:hypothetical protein
VLLMIFFYIRLGLCLPAAIGIAILDRGNCCLLIIKARNTPNTITTGRFLSEIFNSQLTVKS